MARNERAFLDEEARRRAKQTVEKVEQQTSAELVISVQRRSARHREAYWLGGAIAALGVLCVLLFAPRDFAVASMPIDVIVAFTVGAYLVSRSTTLTRWLSGPKTRALAVKNAARAAFVDLGITRTSGRNGILVYASLVEHRVEVVLDLGIDTKRLGPDWPERVRNLERVLEGGIDLDRFLVAVEALGPLLGASMPRAHDDVNELADDVAEAHS